MINLHTLRTAPPAAGSADQAQESYPLILPRHQRGGWKKRSRKGPSTYCIISHEILRTHSFIISVSRRFEGDMDNIFSGLDDKWSSPWRRRGRSLCSASWEKKENTTEQRAEFNKPVISSSERTRQFQGLRELRGASRSPLSTPSLERPWSNGPDRFKKPRHAQRRPLHKPVRWRACWEKHLLLFPRCDFFRPAGALNGGAKRTKKGATRAPRCVSSEVSLSLERGWRVAAFRFSQVKNSVR